MNIVVRRASFTHRYIGYTSRNLYMQVSEHSGRSLSNPPFSSVGEHQFVCETSAANSSFKILDHAFSDFKLRILEPLYICKENPK